MILSGSRVIDQIVGGKSYVVWGKINQTKSFYYFDTFDIQFKKNNPQNVSSVDDNRRQNGNVVRAPSHLTGRYEGFPFRPNHFNSIQFSIHNFNTVFSLHFLLLQPIKALPRMEKS